MKCPECQKQNLKSRVFPGAQIVPAVGYFTYYDEVGNFHQEAKSKITQFYECSNGHSWREIK